MKYFLLAAFLSCFFAASAPAQAQTNPSETKTAKVKKTKKKKKNKQARPDTQAAESAQPDPRPAATPAPVSAPGKPKTAQLPEQAQTPAVKDLEAFVNQTKPVTETKPNGEINWTTQYVTAKGQSVIDNERFKNPAQAKAMARRGAIVEGQRNLLEIIKGVNVVGETKVKDMIAESDYIYTRVDGVIKGAEVIGEAIEKDGMMEVTMRVPLYQPNGLAPVFYNGQINTATARLGNAADAAPASGTASAAASNAAPKFAFNLNGQTFDPSLFPVLVDENSNLLFDLSKLYDPTKGQFPQLVQTTRDAFAQAGFQKGVEFIDIIKTAPGKLVVDDKSKDKINSWKKVGKTLFDIGKLLLLVI